MKTATEIPNPNESHLTGDARLYELSEPVEYSFYDHETDQRGRLDTSYVIVSGVGTMCSGEETYIFPANESGTVLAWRELPGSFQGHTDHTEALAGMGYTA